MIRLVALVFHNAGARKRSCEQIDLRLAPACPDHGAPTRSAAACDALWIFSRPGRLQHVEHSSPIAAAIEMRCIFIHVHYQQHRWRPACVMLRWRHCRQTQWTARIASCPDLPAHSYAVVWTPKDCRCHLVRACTIRCSMRCSSWMSLPLYEQRRRGAYFS